MPEKDIKHLLEDIVELFADTGLSANIKRYGASKSEIEAFEKSIGKSFSSGLKSYFAYFGNAPALPGIYSFSFENIRFAIKAAEEDECYRPYVDNGIIPLKMGEKTIQEPIENTCLVNHIEHNGHYFLIKLDAYNPLLFSSSDLEESFSGYNGPTLATFLRNNLFLEFSLILRVKNDLNESKTVPDHLKEYAKLAARFNTEEKPYLNVLATKRDWHEFARDIQHEERTNDFIYSFSEIVKKLQDESSEPA
mgnify:CR=1 FL=1